MKNILTTFSLILISASAFSQQTYQRIVTTAWNNKLYDENLDFFHAYDEGAGASHHAVYVNPVDEKLYTIKNSGDSGGDRNLYSLNPFTNEEVLVYDFDETYIHTADITPEGVLYFLIGNNQNANAPNGALFSIDLSSDSAMVVDENMIFSGESRALEYNSVDSSLYVYNDNSLNVVSLNNSPLVAESFALTSPFDLVHGGYFDHENNQMFISSESGLHLMDSTNLDYLDLTIEYVHDLSEFDMVEGLDEYTICPGVDSVTLSALYTSAYSYWTKDGVDYMNDGESITISEPGSYRLIQQLGQSTKEIISEEIVITEGDDCPIDWATVGINQRLLGLDSWQEGVFFAEDTTVAEVVEIAAYSEYPLTSNHAIFVNPLDEALHIISDSEIAGGPELMGGGGVGNRNLYRINPFMGTAELVYNFEQDFIHTADVTPDGVVYAVVGNAIEGFGGILTLDLAADSLVETHTGFISSAQESRAAEYNSNDSLLYIYGGYTDAVWTVDVHADSITETEVPTVGASSEIHGALYNEEEDHMILTSYDSEILLSDSSLFEFNQIQVLNYSIMDISDFEMILGENETGYCPNDSTSLVLSAIYDSEESAWLKDGEVVAENVMSITVNEVGEYQLVQKVIDTFSYIRSEVVTVEEFTVPNVNLTAADNDTLICPGDTIMLSGPNGQQFQWYMDGEEIEGATSNTYPATEAGSYNMLKINSSGCSNMSEEDLVIYPDSCPDSVQEILAGGVTMFPVPANDVLNVRADYTIISAIIRDVTGKIVYSQDMINNRFTAFDLSGVARGTYVVELETELGFVSKAIVK